MGKRKDFDEHGVNTYRKGCRCETCRAKVAEQRASYKNPNNGVNYKVRYGSSSLRLPLGPLLDFFERNGHISKFDRSQISRWNRQESMSIYDIDKYCIRFGSHPALIYGDAFYGDIQGDDDEG